MPRQKTLKEKLLYLSLESTTKKIRENFNNLPIIKEFAISLEQWFIIECIGKDPGVNQKAIVNILSKEPASISRIVNKLIDRGFILKTGRDPKSKLQALTLSNKGQMLFTEHKKTIDNEFRQLFSPVFERELYLVIDILKRI